jgi:hypothetical protein
MGAFFFLSIFIERYLTCHPLTYSHPGLSMYALRQYDELMVRAKQRSQKDRKPGWDWFYHNVLWPLVAAHPCFQSLVECVNQHTSVRKYILKNNLLCAAQRTFSASTLSSPFTATKRRLAQSIYLCLCLCRGV